MLLLTLVIFCIQCLVFMYYAREYNAMKQHIKLLNNNLKTAYYQEKLLQTENTRLKNLAYPNKNETEM